MKNSLLLLLLASSVSAGQLAPRNLGDGAFLFHFNEGTGTSVYSSSGAVGTITSLSWVSGIFSKTTQSTAVNQYIKFPTINLSGQTMVSFGAWIKNGSGTAGEGRIIGNGNTNGIVIQYQGDSGAGGTAMVGCFTGSDGNMQGDWGYARPFQNRWAHVVCTATPAINSLIKVYVDGVLVNTYQITGNRTFAGTNPFSLYCQTVGTQKCGPAGVSIDEFFLVPGAIFTKGQIQWMYQEGLGRHSNAR